MLMLPQGREPLPVFDFLENICLCFFPLYINSAPVSQPFPFFLSKINRRGCADVGGKGEQIIYLLSKIGFKLL